MAGVVTRRKRGGVPPEHRGIGFERTAFRRPLWSCPCAPCKTELKRRQEILQRGGEEDWLGGIHDAAFDGCQYKALELAFAERWAAFNHRTGLLNLVFDLADRRKAAAEGANLPAGHVALLKDEMRQLTARERTVAATVVQWLGTNVGGAFLREALKAGGYEVVRIEELDSLRDEAIRFRQGRADVDRATIGLRDEFAMKQAAMEVRISELERLLDSLQPIALSRFAFDDEPDDAEEIPS